MEYNKDTWQTLYNLQNRTQFAETKKTCQKQLKKLHLDNLDNSHIGLILQNLQIIFCNWTELK